MALHIVFVICPSQPRFFGVRGRNQLQCSQGKDSHWPSEHWANLPQVIIEMLKTKGNISFLFKMGSGFFFSNLHAEKAVW